MNKLETLIASGIVGAIALQELQHPGVEHIHNETHGGPDRPIGRSAFEAVVTTGPMRFLSSQMDGNEFLRHRPDSSSYYSYYQGEQQTPFPLRFL